MPRHRHSRRPGRRAWTTAYHPADHPRIKDDPEVVGAVEAFVAEHTAVATGEVVIPSGVHLIHFRAADTAGPR
ncbi:hypothetical protein LO772_26915 [Yinghuangia sp. ASG 101]|uniref:hypothetical protein n=1 Tax=Yinghuangia sp. ASG 101 TaxID=2896848 RepID=UPI001E2D1FE8|nr:hypothetical protein [Yinghuangia sp. ASG 101]UGQ10451.1 hypothetical protein LO772_26915 [Yinghuangia sp. ASG 101]